MKLILFKDEYEELEIPNIQAVCCAIVGVDGVCLDERDLVLKFNTQADRDNAQKRTGLVTTIGGRHLCMPYVSGDGGYLVRPPGESCAIFFPYWKVEKMNLFY